LQKKVTSLNSSRRESQKAQAIMELRHKFDLNFTFKPIWHEVIFIIIKKRVNQPINISEKELIKSIYHKHKGRYGYRRITDELNNKGMVIIKLF
jgi:hypothetical protein